MSTLSVPLPHDMMKALEQLYLEDQAVEAILKASEEPSLKSDLDKLAEKL